MRTIAGALTGLTLTCSRSAYHDDATVDYGFYSGPAAAFIDILAGAMKVSAPTLHRTSNCEIRISGDQAVSESYVVAYVEDAEKQRMVFGRYLDRHTQRAGVWRLSHRTYVLDGNINRQTTIARADPPVSHEHFVPAGAKGAADAGRVCSHSTKLQAAHYREPPRCRPMPPPLTPHFHATPSDCY